MFAASQSARDVARRPLYAATGAPIRERASIADEVTSLLVMSWGLRNPHRRDDRLIADMQRRGAQLVVQCTLAVLLSVTSASAMFYAKSETRSLPLLGKRATSPTAVVVEIRGRLGLLTRRLTADGRVDVDERRSEGVDAESRFDDAGWSDGNWNELRTPRRMVPLEGACREGPVLSYPLVCEFAQLPCY